MRSTRYEQFQTSIQGISMIVVWGRAEKAVREERGTGGRPPKRPFGRTPLQVHLGLPAVLLQDTDYLEQAARPRIAGPAQHPPL